jgi:hypothetical protein
MKPECNEYKKIIARSLMEDLADREQKDLDSHLATCAHCRSEKERYQHTLDLMQSMEDAPAPRHFFIHSDERKLNPRQIFPLMKLHWQIAAAAFAGIFILAGIGWSMSFSRHDIDVAALKKDILQSVEKKNQDVREAWMHEMRAEIMRARTDLTQQQKDQLTAAFYRLDSRIANRLQLHEARTKDQTTETVNALYNDLSRQRTRDLNFLLTRFNSIEANSALKERETDVILDTLLQVAELRLK